MKKIIYVVCLLTVTVFSQQAFAQDARSAFEKASQAYDAGNYSESLAYANEAERALGKTNAKIQSLKTILYYEQGDLKNAALQLAIYFRTSPDRNSTDYDDMKSLQQELATAVKQDHEADLRKIKALEKSELEDVAKGISNETEAYHFSVAKTAGTLNAMKLFLSKYPAGTFLKEANSIISAKETVAIFDMLVSDGDQLMANEQPKAAVLKYTAAAKIKSDAIVATKLTEAKQFMVVLATKQGNADFYFKRWSNAINNYTDVLSMVKDPEISKNLAIAKEELAFETAKKLGTTESYRNYISNYPQGLYSTYAKGILIGHYLTQAEKKSKEGVTDEVKTNLDAAYSFQQTIIFTHYADRYYQILAQEAKRLTTGKKSFRMSNATAAIGYYEQLSNYSKTYNDELTHLKRKKRAWSRDDYGYFAIRSNGKFDEVGFDLGFNANTKTSAFISVRGSLKSLQETGSNAFSTGGLDHFSVFANLNFTRKIVYPIWIYAGAGYVNYVKIDQITGEPGKGIITEDHKKGEGAVNIDAGLIFNLKPITLTVGGSFPQFNTAQKTLLNIKNPIVFTPAVGIRYVL